MRLLRNANAHDDLIESVASVLADALHAAPELAETVRSIIDYVRTKQY